jgi:hypothetical protein
MKVFDKQGLIVMIVFLLALIGRLLLNSDMSALLALPGKCLIIFSTMLQLSLASALFKDNHIRPKRR